ncbi:MAG: NAD-dependent epimerase/dehydratase family protein [Candidatus Margulisbacteria bacterium]|nr:NAD-dependent epimerase/dehydratase family protein [Candidatus Margulisiibacteriota bacterium]MBU1022063.1 NAD-dependent epimerase/dehydratase family protein [Candidatus Margulisiibacteriota bacterium]MBU1729658.1 NAD-dependent epimerase/dehydratase family protein [Candidatus Margulisiibacteriota bacterium]MBU1954978.1 NAD-dependent epimerase/dehydratase family protein [Candidatus Margulisiibacteriota bacterium]
MKILVTGGAGFIGSTVVDVYLANGHEVVIVDDLSSGKKENIPPQAKFYKVDVTSPKLEEVFKKEKPQIVSHLAAQIDVRRSVEDPAFDVKINILGMINLLNQCVKYKVEKIIFSSTGGALYGEVEGDPADEDMPLVPISGYAIDKRAAEMYLSAYSANYGLKYTVLRYGNVYGPRQDPHGEAGVVAIFCGKILDNAAPFIYGDGEQLRDYVYVRDVAEANVIALTKGDNDVYNIGTAVGSSVNTLFNVLKDATNFKKDAIYKPARLGELQVSILSYEKARRDLGWKPEVDIKEGLKLTFDWFKSKR